MALGSRSRRRAPRRPRSVTPARWVAWQVVHRTFADDAWTDRVLAAEADRADLPPRERAFAQHLAFGTVQHARTLDHVIGVVGRRPLRKIDAPVLAALRLGTFQLLFSGGTAAHAAVDQSVEIVRAAVGERAVAFTNAVLRRAQVDGRSIIDRLDPDDADDLATLLSFPTWMVRRMQEAFGPEGIEALSAQNRTTHAVAEQDADAPPAATTTPMRANPLRMPLEQVDAELERLGVVTSPPPAAFGDALPEARMVHGGTTRVGQLVALGVLLPQSLASMLVAHAVDPLPGERVLDMCAAPGGKTTHIAALMRNEGDVLACELHEHRSRSLAAVAERAGATIVRVLTADATTLTPEEQGSFDRVLVDAPCSGLGVLAGRPDARWKRSEDDLAGLADLQRRLVRTAASMVRPGGEVVYSTCTLLPDENEHVVDWALRELPLEAAELDQVPRWLRLPDAGYAARTWPHLHGSDGFFMARMRRGGS